MNQNMENGQNEASKALPGKKELKHQLTDKIETALPELREMLGEKKFARRVKKAAKLLMQGLHDKDVAKKSKQLAKKAIATKKTAQKAAAKKTATKTAEAAPAKKAKAANKK